MKKHALIVGARHVGKSTLIRRVLDEIGLPVFGFETRKEDELERDDLGSPVYIYDAGCAHTQTQENLVGYCKDRRPLVYKEAFDRFAPKLAAPPADSIVVLDEIGFMESTSEAFCAAIMQLLDGDIPVLAAVKHNSTPFLDAVKAHPNAQCFRITEENRDTLLDEVMDFVKARV